MKLDVQVLAPTRERRVARHLEGDAHHPEHRTQETLGLPQWQTENQTKRQRRLDCQVRVPALATALAIPRRPPRGVCLGREPDGDVAGLDSRTNAALYVGYVERLMGLEPATFSLGS